MWVPPFIACVLFFVLFVLSLKQVAEGDEIFVPSCVLSFMTTIIFFIFFLKEVFQ